MQTKAQAAKAPRRQPVVLAWARPAAVAQGRLRQVRPGRAQGPLAHQEDLAAPNLHRNWVMIPHVTNHDEADITDLEAFRVQINKENEKSGDEGHHAGLRDQGRGAQRCKKFPEFNSLARRRQPGLQEVLPHRLCGRHAQRPGGAGASRMPTRRASCRSARKWASWPRRRATASWARPTCRAAASPSQSLGGIGGTYFTPIVNAPEVAILGVCKAAMKPDVGRQGTSQPRLILPLSLSWDHRVIDGAAAARFNVVLGLAAGGLPPHRAVRKGRHMAIIDIKVPDIGDFDEVAVIEAAGQAGRQR